MSSDNGGIIGVVNDPTSTTASGVWQQEEQYEAKVNDTWPQRPLFTTNSCRFNDGSSDYLSRTPGSTGNTKKFTVSFWLKRGTITGADQNIFHAYPGSGSRSQILFNSSEQLLVDLEAGNTNRLITTRVFRDTSAWYHIVIVYDSDNGTSGNRVIIYINGVRETSFGTETYPSSGSTSQINTTTQHEISSYDGSGSYFDGYLAEFVLLDGTVADPTSFGVTNSDGVWTPIPYTGTFGTNGFNLQFEDASSLGTDSSANGNNFTVNNLTSIDQSTDYPVVNFATLNPLYHYIDSATLSEGNLKFTTSGNSSKGRAISTIRPESGKWYVECKIIDVTRFQIGIMNGNETNSAQGGSDANSVILGYNGDFYFNSSQYTNYIADPSNNDIVQLALDLDNDLFWFGVNDTWGNSATRTEIENGTATNSGSTDIGSQVPVNTGAIGIFLEDNSGTGNNVAEINFGSPSFTISSGNSDGNGYGNFEYAVPSGYYALNTANLAEFG